MISPAYNEILIEAPGNAGSPRRRRDGCTECRRKKVKCDLQKPVCSRCSRFPKQCCYDLSIIPSTTLKLHKPRRLRRNSNRELRSLTPKRGPSPSPSPPQSMSLIYQPSMNPSPFLSSDESRFLMHIFGTQTAKMLFPAAPDFFLQRMICAAMETPHLLYALLASACSHHSRLIKDSTPNPKVTCLKYTNMAIASLRETLQDADRSLNSSTITTAMALCTNDVCNGNMHVWRTHLRGVLRLLAACLKYQRDSYAVDDPYLLSLAKWFKTMDIIAALSGLEGECIHDPEDGPLDRGSILGGDFIDYICGYSLDLIPYMVRISQMVRVRGRVHSYDDTSMVDDILSPQTMAEAELLEDSIMSLIDKPLSDSASVEGEATFSVELRNTHLAFVHSTLLHLHRRVQLLPIDDIKVRIDVRNILDAISNIDPTSTANILILWPVFSAGCETTIPSERDMIRERMSIMQNFGMGNFTRTRNLLEQFWEASSELRWDEYFAQLGLELVLF